jgi:hypothetical protein
VSKSGQTRQVRFGGSLVFWVLLIGIFPQTSLSIAQTDKQADEPAVMEVDELIRRRLAGNDNWETEVLYVRAKKQLKKLSDQLIDAERRQNLDLTGIASENCRSTAMNPGASVDARVVNGYVVRRATAETTSPKQDKPVVKSLQELMKPYAQTGGQRIEFKALRFDKHDEQSFSTQMLFQCFGPTPGGFTQQNATWNIHWQLADDPQHPQMVKIEVSDFVEIAAPGLQFVDHTDAILGSMEKQKAQLVRGAEYWHGRVDTLGGIALWGHQGIAIGDVNGDDLEDVYVSQCTGKPNLLLVQNPDGTTTDIAADAGVDFFDDTRGVLLIDVDNDGDQDLCCALGSIILVSKNDGQGRFVPSTALRAPDPAEFYSLSAADFDLDGDLDLYATRYVAGQYGVSIPIPWHDANNGPSNHLFQNDGAGKFSDATRELGLDVNNRRFSLAASWADYDNDGDLDLYVANDFGRNCLYRNDGEKFEDIAAASGTEDQSAGMGVSWADYDLDGNVDLHVSNMFSSAGNRIAYQRRFRRDESQTTLAEFQRHARGNSLYHNQGDGTFVDVSVDSGITMGRWSWGSRFVDINNDGYSDIVTPNGFLTNKEKDDL